MRFTPVLKSHIGHEFSLPGSQEEVIVSFKITGLHTDAEFPEAWGEV